MAKSEHYDIKSELFQCFRRGFRHGVLASAGDPAFLTHKRADIVAAYERGYLKGRDTSMLVMAEECERIGYDPRMSILRAPVDSRAGLWPKSSPEPKKS
jgi:hypothetical protein